MSIQFVGRSPDGSLELLPSAHPGVDHIAVYQLQFTAHYYDVRVESLLFHDNPVKSQDGQHIGPYAYLFYHSTRKDRPIYGDFVGEDKYAFESWYAFLPYETLSNVHVTISLLFPLPRGVKSPQIANHRISPELIPLTEDQRTFLPEWFAGHRIDEDDLLLHDSVLSFDVRAIPVTTPQEAASLSHSDWKQRLGPTRWYFARYPDPSYSVGQLLTQPPEGTKFTHHPRKCCEGGMCDHRIYCGYCHFLVAAPDQWSDAFSSAAPMMCAFRATSGALSRLIVEDLSDCPVPTKRPTLVRCPACRMPIAHITDYPDPQQGHSLTHGYTWEARPFPGSLYAVGASSGFTYDD